VTLQPIGGSMADPNGSVVTDHHELAPLGHGLMVARSKELGNRVSTPGLGPLLC
jgi:hypothetical protein